MIVVIIAGGSGTRLWPLSTPDYPKHLLKIDGDERTLLQQAYDRARKLTGKIYVVSEKSHAEHVRQQLPDLPGEAFIIEPARRGTANCIVAALAAINESANDEAIAFMHADHYIRDVRGFSLSFNEAEKAAIRHKHIVLVGVEPDYPATGFGYIEKGDLLHQEAPVFNVRSFKEKPNLETAQAYVKSGNYLWNGGYFLATLATFLKDLESYAPDIYQNYKTLLASNNKEDYEQAYLSFEAIAIDYALIEKAQNLLVVPATFDWVDLGSFDDLSKVASQDSDGNVLQGENIQADKLSNSMVQNNEAKPIAVIGLDNVVVINTPQGLLVARKDLSQRVGEVSKKFQQ